MAQGFTDLRSRLERSKLLLAVFCFIWGSTLAEVGLRFHVRAWPFETEVPSSPNLTSKDSTLKWRYSPNFERNSLGLKNRKITKKKSNQYRILILGDSLIARGETSSGKLFTTIVEENLNKRFGKREVLFEVINAGIAGYTTYQELEFLRIYGLDMEPDLVILGIVFNDTYFKYLHRPAKNYQLLVDPSSLLNRFDKETLPGYFFQYSYLAHSLVQAFEVIQKNLSGEFHFSFERRYDFFLSWKKYGWRNTKRLLLSMKRTLHESKIGMMIMIFPVSEQIDEDIRKMDPDFVLFPQKRLEEICEEIDIPCLDFTEDILRGGGHVLYDDYLHLNKRGNDIVSNKLTEFISEDHLLGGKEYFQTKFDFVK